MMYFPRKRRKTVFGGQVPFEKKGVPSDENEYNLFYGKWDYEYFFIKQFFRKKQYFLRKWQEKIFRRHDHFLDEVILAKIEYNLFYYKLDAKYFHVKQFFWRTQYFLRKLQKTILRAHMTIF